MAQTLASTPAADGFHMPAEWEQHDGTWMAWPERTDNWRDRAEPAQRAFTEVALAIAASERVTMAVSARQVDRCRAALLPAVRVAELPSDDAWMRDIGPTFVVNRSSGERRGIDWVFNAWGGHAGGLYASWDADDRVAQRVCEIELVDRYRAPFVLEGGAIDVDGDGTVLVTEECLLNPNRNPDLGRPDIERLLGEYLGVEQVVWLGRGVVDDETDGHVDNLCRFTAPGEVVLSWTDDPGDRQREVSLDARRRLEAATDARGRSLAVRLLPSPGPLHATQEERAGIVGTTGTKPRRAGDRLAASYVNFSVANSCVVVPRLDARHDDEAAEVLAACYPDREVVGVETREILLGGGSVHCITQQVPRR